MSNEEKRTKNSLKRFIRRFPQYKSVNDIDDADIAMIFTIENTEKFMVLEITSSNKEDLKNVADEKLKIFFLKHKNPRNKKQLIVNDIDRNHFKIQR